MARSHWVMIEQNFAMPPLRFRKESVLARSRKRSDRRVRNGAVVLLLIASSLCACASSLPVPTIGPHPAATTTYVEVPYPPPAARVEVVPPKPSDAGAVWVDGEWSWLGKGWNWLPGGWVAPPVVGAYFAPWLVYRLEDGRLLFAPGAWHASSGERLPNPIVLEAARNGLTERGDQPAESPSSVPPSR